MPSPTNRRIRYTLTAIGALGMIGAGSAAIIAGSTSGETEIRLAATTPDAVVTNEQADEPAETTASPSASASASAPASATPSASTKPSPSASSKPSTKTGAKASASASIGSQAKPKAGKTATPASTKTTAAPAGDDSVAAEILRLVNAERQAAGCDGLTSESRLDAAAQKHSQLQADQDTMSHQLPGEASMGDRVTAEGYQWRGVAENVAAGYTSAASVMEGWMNSPGHKANILNCSYEELGVGLAKSSSGTRYWTQNFATPA